MQQVSKNQIAEWIENPVTIAFREYAKYERQTTIASKGLDAFCAFEPQRTQEILAHLNGAADAWGTIEDSLSESDELLALLELLEEDDE